MDAACFSILPRCTIASIPEIIYDRDCTVLFATNTFLSKYAQVAHPYDFYSIKYLVVGAEKLTEDVQRLCMEKFGLRVFEGYGATECSPVIAVNTPLAARIGIGGRAAAGHGLSESRPSKASRQAVSCMCEATT